MLKEMIENLINENTEQAEVDFHGYLNNKMKGLNEGYSVFDHIDQLDNLLMHTSNQRAEEAWEEAVYKHKGEKDYWKDVSVENVRKGIRAAEEIISKFDIEE